VEIDPEGLFPDVDRDNNVWDSAKGAGSANGVGSER
jgi:hypothetical protein